MVWNLKKLEENKLLKRNYDLCMFSTQALTNDKVYLLVLYMGDGGGGGWSNNINSHEGIHYNINNNQVMLKCKNS